MRYFLLLWFLLVVVGVSVLGFRGDLSRKPPLEVFDDMDRQFKLKPQQAFDFFSDGRASRLPVEGTVAHSAPLASLARVDPQNPVYAFEQHPATTGLAPGTTNYVPVNPLPITAEFMARGRQRYDINCLPCHGPLGDGNGVTKKLGMAVVANLHDARIVQMADGELFHVITHGRNLMGGYAATVDIEDRWAIIAYLRALQLSRLGTIDDVPPDQRAALTK